MRFVVLGDTHGNTNAALQAVDWTRDRGMKIIVQVGDFGLWDHKKDGVKFLDTLNERLRLRGVKMHVVGGNHENWDRWEWYVANNPKDYHGFTYLRSHIRIAPKVHTWGWNGKKCLMVGGAVSIDKQWRKAGESWWANEVLTWDEVEAAKAVGPVDYLFTHDCSNRTPWRDRLKPDLDSMTHRQRIDDILKATTPKFHFHGHMHTKYDWQNLVGDDKWTQTYGLECDGDWNNMGIFNTDTGVFQFRGDVYRKEELNRRNEVFLDPPVEEFADKEEKAYKSAADTLDGDF